MNTNPTNWTDWQWAGSPFGVAWSHTDITTWLGVLAMLVLAGLIGRVVQKSTQPRSHPVWLGRQGWDGLLTPLLVVVALWLLGLFWRADGEKAVLSAAMYLSSVWALGTGVVRVLRSSHGEGGWMRPIAIAWIWISVALWILWGAGFLSMVQQELGEVTWHLGGTQWTLRSVLEGIFTTGLVLILALWASSALEAYLLKDAGGNDLSLRKMLSNSLRVLLVFIGLMVSLNTVGIDLTALSVLGGAVGVGIGFGLQKLAANYVSGFVILGERSVRIGDMVRIDGFEGAVVDIRGRYTVIRAPTGVESIVPNEVLITARVENLSLADPRVWLSTNVTVGYDSDPDQVMALLEQAAAAQDRVLTDPPPRAILRSFGADGLDFLLGFWIEDLENGRGSVTSEVNLSILKSLRAHNIDIPYPQRTLHWAPGADASGNGGRVIGQTV